ncbi:hypothetical protein NDU88_009118 [Pleurodeles waltl]|uniref:Uncharacterized protein n=1 Tax=Pleurodeles waltl TaxID=8319 RepID=A0AAV7PRV1_PLEWA|nr:hypothetical protein NDU88_009118 [Pleurodeles waltl]
MDERQENLEKAMEKFLSVAAEDRETRHKALTGKTLSQDTATSKLTDVLGQQRGHTALRSVVLQKFARGEDPGYLFNNFEHMAQAAALPADRWGQYIDTLLAGDPQATYQVANPLGTTSYEDIKRSILEWLGVDEETYHARQCQIREGSQETP